MPVMKKDKLCMDKRPCHGPMMHGPMMDDDMMDDDMMDDDMLHGHMMHEHAEMAHMPECLILAHAYVPWQVYQQAFSPCEALMKGTLFPELWGAYPIPE